MFESDSGRSAFTISEYVHVLQNFILCTTLHLSHLLNIVPQKTVNSIGRVNRKNALYTKVG